MMRPIWYLLLALVSLCACAVDSADLDSRARSRQLRSESLFLAQGALPREEPRLSLSTEAGTTCTWIGSYPHWNSSLNWDCLRTPTAQDDVILPARMASFVLNVGTTGARARTLTIEGGTLSVAPDAHLTVTDRVQVTGGSTTVEGTLEMGGHLTVMAGDFQVANLVASGDVSATFDLAPSTQITHLEVRKGASSSLSLSRSITLRSTTVSSGTLRLAGTPLTLTQSAGAYRTTSPSARLVEEAGGALLHPAGRLRFLDGPGGSPLTAERERSTVYVELLDEDEDTHGGEREATLVTLTLPGRDPVPLNLVETGESTGIFEAAVALGSGVGTATVSYIDGEDASDTKSTHLTLIDGTPPEPPLLTSAPRDPSNQTPSFHFQGEPSASFQCRIDASDWYGCSSPVSYSGLFDGRHTFSVRQRDRAGNISESVSHAWTLDRRPPRQPVIDDAPWFEVNRREVTFAFHGEAGGRFECRLDGAAPAACTSPTHYMGLSEGRHAFEIWQIDDAGNISLPTSVEFLVDLVPPPPPTFTLVPPARTRST